MENGAGTKSVGQCEKDKDREGGGLLYGITMPIKVGYFLRQSAWGHDASRIIVQCCAMSVQIKLPYIEMPAVHTRPPMQSSE